MLGTFVDLYLSGDVSDKVLLTLSNTIFDEISRIQALMSFHDPVSELSLMNKALLRETNTPYQISTDLYNVLNLAKNLYQYSHGYYDITVAPQLVINNVLPDHLSLKQTSKDFNHRLFGSSNNFSLHEEDVNNATQSKKYIVNRKPLCIDLGGIAKGYAIDCAVNKIPKSITYTINAGGDMRTSLWQGQDVALKYAKRHKAIKQVTMINQALASSGLYHQEARSHIVNPTKMNKNHQLIEHKFGGVVSVFAKTAMIADALTKVVVLMNKSEITPILKRFEANAVIINRFGFKRSINI